MEPQPLTQVISEEDFLLLAKEPCQRFFLLFNSFLGCLEKDGEISRKFYSDINKESEFLECFLDGHGARENKRWMFFSEFVASIRNLGISAFYFKHVTDRFPFYHLNETDDEREAFLSSAKETRNFLKRSLANLYKATCEEGLKIGLNVPEDQICPEDFSELESHQKLPRNILEEEVKDETDSVIDLCEKVKMAAAMMKENIIPKTENLDEMLNWVPSRLNEKKTRMFQSTVHSVQSDFDTYVKNTRLEHDYPELKSLRGNISSSLHLIEGLLWMCHFYERHEDEIRSSECKRRISLMVDKRELLGHIFNFAFHYSVHFIDKANQVAVKMLKTLVKTVRAEVPVPKPLGFHARPSTYVSLIARQGEGELFMILDGEKINAKSVMSLLQAGGMIADKGYEQVTFEGSKHMIDDIKILAKHNYCEDGEVPRALSYLNAAKRGG